MKVVINDIQTEKEEIQYGDGQTQSVVTRALINYTVILSDHLQLNGTVVVPYDSVKHMSIADHETQIKNDILYYVERYAKSFQINQ
jgi:uncharacterized lipoprotein YehR (DUF1307 family)